MKDSTRKILFILMIFLTYILSLYLRDYLSTMNNNIDSHMLNFIMGLLFTLIIVVIFFMGKTNCDKEGFWEISKGAQCKGGEYLYQGDSPRARMCRELESTPQGRCEISSYNCPTGFVGQPKNPLYFSQLTDDDWNNQMCDKDKPEKCELDSLCSFSTPNTI